MKKKPDFKKLALMGITGGVMIASNASAAVEPNTINTQQLLAAGCGGHGCGHYTAYEPRGGSCSAMPSQNDPYQGQRTAAGCSAAPMPTYQNQGQRMSSGCGAAQPQNYNNQPNQRISSGCGAQTKPRQANNASQWDQIADNSKGNGNGGNADDNLVLSQLNEEGKAIYRGLSPEGKALAQKLINQTCKGQNDCKGLNSCKSKDNSCAGKGACKGTSPGPFKDKNDAVKVAAQKMAEKRAGANSRY